MKPDHTHIRSDYRPWEQYVTCCKCAHPLDNNQRMKDALKVNTRTGWAQQNLKILEEMAEDRGLAEWFIAEVRRIKEGLRCMID